MTRSVLLTGSTGFVGRQILLALRDHGASVRVVVRPRAGGSHPPTGAHSTVNTPDLFAESVEWWEKATRGVDVVIHAAWYAEPGKYLQSPLNLHCLRGTLSLAEGAVRAGVKKVVGVGTCAEYDLTAGDLASDAPLKPGTPYAGAKAAAYLALSQYLAQEQVAFAWCRLFYMYGEGEDPRRLVPHLRAKLGAGEAVDLTAGHQVRDFLDVRDAGRLIAEAGLGSAQGALNVCSGVPITVRALAERVADEYGRRDLLRFGARPENAFDPPRVVGIPSKIGVS